MKDDFEKERQCGLWACVWGFFFGVLGWFGFLLYLGFHNASEKQIITATFAGLITTIVWFFMMMIIVWGE